MVDEYAVEILIKGKVLNVDFEKEAKKNAGDFGIVGYVQPLPDQSLLIHAQGPAKELKRFKNWCAYGTENSQIDSLVEQEVRPILAYDFEIRTAS